MDRYILDTNVLLTGIFAPQSDSRKLLGKIQNGEILGYITANTIGEAFKAIERARDNTGVDLTGLLRGSIYVSRLIILPIISKHESSNYPTIKGNEDKLLVATAKKIDATICTNDLEDFRDAGTYKVNTCTPYDLTRTAHTTLNDICTGFIASPNEGTFYVEIPDIGWKGVKFKAGSPNKMFFFDAISIGCLYFDTSNHAFVYQNDAGVSLILEYGVVEKEKLPLRIVLAYKHDIGIKMHIGYHSEKAATDVTWAHADMPKRTNISIGSDRNKNNQLNGNLLYLFSLPSIINERAANNLMAGKTTKHPWERLGLEDIIRIMYS